MKQLCITSFLILFFSSSLLAQEEKIPLLFDEFTVSVNRTTSLIGSNPFGGDTAQNHFGFGFGAYRGFRRGKQFNVIVGLEYNYTSQFYKRVQDRHRDDPDSHGEYTNTLSRTNNLSIPIDLRFNFGQQTKFFFQTGIFLDYGFYQRLKGNYISYNSSPYAIFDSTSSVNKYQQINTTITRINAGFSLGAGVDIPLDKINLIVKADYKFALAGLIAKGSYFLGYARISVGLRLKKYIQNQKEENK